ncbi:hypothetical protein DFH05DRAFT_1530542 [Lentinula detonsa]|uniref:Chromatin elongation factor SPT5 n=1 Tax=Lentinula detonsa TaxID=2804962 RepID=A0A9W8NR46_9AGAR|nr:hypothetical protein DFH05DRAFT_1530542 [Lentinula detonsa]
MSSNANSLPNLISFPDDRKLIGLNNWAVFCDHLRSVARATGLTGYLLGTILAPSSDTSTSPAPPSTPINARNPSLEEWELRDGRLAGIIYQNIKDPRSIGITEMMTANGMCRDIGGSDEGNEDTVNNGIEGPLDLHAPNSNAVAVASGSGLTRISSPEPEPISVINDGVSDPSPSNVQHPYIPCFEDDEPPDDFDLEDSDFTKPDVLKRLIDELLDLHQERSHSFDVYLVRCQRGQERDIVRRIRSDVEVGAVNPDIIDNAFLSQLPGWFYLHVQNMLVQNSPLNMYLMTIDGLIYPHSQNVPYQDGSVRPVPIHHYVPFYDRVNNSVLFDPSSRVVTTRGLYKGDIGIVVDPGPRPLRNDQCQVLFVPRLAIPRPKIDSSQKRKAPVSRPIPVLATATAMNTISLNAGADVTPAVIRCTFPRCNYTSERHRELEHEKEYPITCRFLRQDFQATLAVQVLPVQSLKPATSIQQQTWMNLVSAAPDHIALQDQQIFDNAPPPAEWVFSAGEKVQVFVFGDNVTRKRLVEVYQCGSAPSGTEGIIESVDDLFCMIKITSRPGISQTYDELVRVYKHHLRKVFSLGDVVAVLSPGKAAEVVRDLQTQEILAHGNSDQTSLALQEYGFVIEIIDFVAQVKMFDRQFDLSIHVNLLGLVPDIAKHPRANLAPSVYDGSHWGNSEVPSSSRLRSAFTGLHPQWKGIAVKIVGDNIKNVGARHRKGYEGTVVDITQSANTVSGLNIYVHLSGIGIQNPWLWVDFDDLRQIDNSRFLHDSGAEELQFARSDDLSSIPPIQTRNPISQLQIHMQQRSTHEDQVALRDRQMWEEQFLEGGGGSTPMHSSQDTVGQGSGDPNDPWIIQDSARSDQPLNHWILHPAIARGLGGRDILTIITAGEFFQGSTTDSRICLRLTQRGHVKVFHQTTHQGGNKSLIPVELPPDCIIAGAVKSNTLPDVPTRAMGLYVVVEGVHVGKLTHQVGRVANPDGRNGWDWKLQVVLLTKLDGKGDKHNQELVDEPLIVVH